MIGRSSVGSQAQSAGCWWCQHAQRWAGRYVATSHALPGPAGAICSQSLPCTCLGAFSGAPPVHYRGRLKTAGAGAFYYLQGRRLLVHRPVSDNSSNGGWAISARQLACHRGGNFGPRPACLALQYFWRNAGASLLLHCHWAQRCFYRSSWRPRFWCH